MEKCLADVINDPQALKDFLRSTSQSDGPMAESDMGLSGTSLDEALSSSLDFLASITSSVGSSTAGDFSTRGDLQISGLESSLLYGQVTDGIDYDVFSQDLRGSAPATLQSNAVTIDSFAPSFPSSSGQQLQIVQSNYVAHGTQVGLKQTLVGNGPTPGAVGPTSQRGTTASKREKAQKSRIQQATVAAGATKASPINIDQVVDIGDAKAANVFPTTQQAVVNNGLVATNGQAILLPSAAGKMFIVNSPGKGSQAIALPAEFLQQPQPQTTFISGANQNANVSGKQLFVLPSQLQSPQGMAAIGSAPISQTNLAYASTLGMKGKVPNVVTASDGQLAIASGSPANSGVQNVSLLVSSQPREILPKRAIPVSTPAQHHNILPKVSAAQASGAAKLLTAASTSLKPRVQLYAASSPQVPNQTQQYMNSSSLLAGNQQQAYTIGSQQNPTQSTLSILQATVRNATSANQAVTAGPLPVTITHPNQSNVKIAASSQQLNQGTLRVGSPKMPFSGQKASNRRSDSPLKRGQSPLKQQQNVIFNPDQTVATGQLPSTSVGVTQRTVNTVEVFTASQVPLSASTVQTIPTMAMTPTMTVAQAPALTSSSVPQPQLVPVQSLPVGVQHLQPTGQIAVSQQQQLQQPQYSLLGKEGIQKLMQLCHQQGQATGQKLTSLGSLGAANLTALMQKLLAMQQQQQQQQQIGQQQQQQEIVLQQQQIGQQQQQQQQLLQTGQPLQLAQGNTLTSQQFLQASIAQLSTLASQSPVMAPVAQVSTEYTLHPKSTLLPISGNVIHSMPILSWATGSQPTSVQFIPSTDSTLLVNTLNADPKDNKGIARPSTENPHAALAFKALSNGSPALKSQVISQPKQTGLGTSTSRPGDNKPLLVQLPQDKGTGITSFSGTGHLTQMQLQDLQQKLLAQKINQQAQSMMPKQLLTSSAQASQGVTFISTTPSNVNTVKANVVYIKPTARPAGQVSIGGSPALAKVAVSTILSSNPGLQPSQVVVKPLFSTATTLAVGSLVASQATSSPSVTTKAVGKAAGSVGEIQLSPQGHQKIIISKQIRDQLQSLSAAQKEQLLRNPKQVLVINGQKIPLAQLLQQLADEAKVTTKSIKVTKRPLPNKEAEEKVSEEAESKVTKRLKHCLSADQARVLKPERDKPFRSAEDALSKLIPYHVFYEKIPDRALFQKDEAIFDSVAEQLLEKKEELTRRFDSLLLNEFQRSVSTAEVVMLSRLFVNDERSLLQKDKQDAQEGKFQLRLQNQAEEESESEDDDSVSDNLTCPEDVEFDTANSDEDVDDDDGDFMESNNGIAGVIDTDFPIEAEMDSLHTDITADADMAQELNEATSNLLADLESEDMFAL